MAAAVTPRLRRHGGSGKWAATYRKWFLTPTPTGELSICRCRCNSPKRCARWERRAFSGGGEASSGAGADFG